MGVEHGVCDFGVPRLLFWRAAKKARREKRPVKHNCASHNPLQPIGIPPLWIALIHEIYD